MPALSIRMSRVLCSALYQVANSSIDKRSARSNIRKDIRASGTEEDILLTTDLAPATLTSAMITDAPLMHNTSAKYAPSPEAPPVTIANLPSIPGTSPLRQSHLSAIVDRTIGR